MPDGCGNDVEFTGVGSCFHALNCIIPVYLLKS
jgi:hypothetical protein